MMTMTPLERSHLHLAYELTWVIQLLYLSYVVYRLRRSKKPQNSRN